MARTRKKKQIDRYNPNFWGMSRDVLIAGMNKGQLIPVSITLILMILAIKLPSDKVYELFTEIIGYFVTFQLLGWVLFVATTLGWYKGTKHQRRIHTEEIKRISKEKTLVQEKSLKRKLPSSNKL